MAALSAAPHRSPHAHPRARLAALALVVVVPILCCAAGFRLARARAESLLAAHHADVGAGVEPDGRLCRSRFRRPAGLRRHRRLWPVRAHHPFRARPRGLHSACRRSGGDPGRADGSVVFRLRGAYFAIGTWVTAEVFRLLFAQFKGLGGGTGTSLPPEVTSASSAWVSSRICSAPRRPPPATSSTTGWP